MLARVLTFFRYKAQNILEFLILSMQAGRETKGKEGEKEGCQEGDSSKETGGKKEGGRTPFRR